MEIVQQVQKRMLFSLAQISKNMDLKEGDYLVVEQVNGGIFLRPVNWHNKSQEYIWTEECQESIRRSEEDLKTGQYKTFANWDDCIKDLEEIMNADNKENV